MGPIQRSAAAEETQQAAPREASGISGVDRHAAACHSVVWMEWWRCHMATIQRSAAAEETRKAAPEEASGISGLVCTHPSQHIPPSGVWVACIPSAPWIVKHCGQTRNQLSPRRHSSRCWRSMSSTGGRKRPLARPKSPGRIVLSPEEQQKQEQKQDPPAQAQPPHSSHPLQESLNHPIPSVRLETRLWEGDWGLSLRCGGRIG